MTKLITMKFTVTIKDEDAPNVMPDEDVKRELIEAYNDFIRADECSDVEIIIEEAEQCQPKDDTSHPFADDVLMGGDETDDEVIDLIQLWRAQDE